ncbi:MAG: sugar phosphate isomerase/epimerase [Kiritimatiellae bacterium]|nr:sugar phosphate isomerase/epimerase [Kiritimatiellia bacterium]
MTTCRSVVQKFCFGFAVAGMAASLTCSVVAQSADRPYGNPADTFQPGIAGFTFHKKTLDETLEVMKKVDVHYLCIKDFHLSLNSTDEQIQAFHEKCAKYDVKGYGCGPIYMGSEDAARKAFEYAKRCGVKILVGVPYEDQIVDGKKQRVGSRKLLEYIDKLVKEFDIKYAIHNHGPDMPLLFPTADNAYEMIKDLDPRVGLCMDIGHQLRFNYDPVESFRKYHDRVFDLHLKNVTDNSKKGGAIQLPRGKINLVEMVKVLREFKYSGICSLEYERDFNDNLEGVAECIGYFRGLMDATR